MEILGVPEDSLGPLDFDDAFDDSYSNQYKKCMEAFEYLNLSNFQALCKKLEKETKKAAQG